LKEWDGKRKGKKVGRKKKRMKEGGKEGRNFYLVIDMKISSKWVIDLDVKSILKILYREIG
jgi:hypothetical protein